MTRIKRNELKDYNDRMIVMIGCKKKVFCVATNLVLEYIRVIEATLSFIVKLV